MNNQGKTILWVVAFAVLIVAAVVAYNALKKDVIPQNLQNTQRNTSTQSSKTNTTTSNVTPTAADKTKAPDFTVLDKDGNKVKLSSLFGKPIVLNFWASWCPPCKGEMPEFNTVYQEMGKDVTFVMVDMVDGQRETMQTGMQFIKSKDFSFPVYYDTEQEAATKYGVDSIPGTLFIDKDGYIVTGAQGAIDTATLKLGIGMIK